MSAPVFLGAILYLTVISVISSAVTVSDKLRAQRGRWRVRESTLLLFALMGGSAAQFITMLVIRHKTRHRKFMLGLPLIFIMQAAALVLLYMKWMP